MPKSGKKGTFGCIKDGPMAPQQSAIAARRQQQPDMAPKMVDFLNRLRNGMQSLDDNVRILQNRVEENTAEQKRIDGETRTFSKQHDHMTRRMDDLDTKLGTLKPPEPYNDTPVLAKFEQLEATQQLLMSSVNTAVKRVDDVSESVATRAELRILDDRVKNLASRSDDSNLSAKVRALAQQMGNLGKAVVPDVTNSVMLTVREELAKSAAAARGQSKTLETTVIGAVSARMTAAIESHAVVRRLQEDLSNLVTKEDLAAVKLAELPDLSNLVSKEDFAAIKKSNDMLKSMIDGLVSKLAEQRKMIDDLTSKSPESADLSDVPEVAEVAEVAEIVEAPKNAKTAKKSKKKGRK